MNIKKSVIITIPVLNEEKTLRQQINLLSNFISTNLETNYEVSIVIANNGSTDSTKSIGSELAMQNSNIHMVSSSKKGVGLALKKSWQNYPGDFLGYMDLDFASDLSHIKESIVKLENTDADIIAGSRLLKSSRVFQRGLLRTVTSISFNKIISLTFNTKFTDGMCGFKFFANENLEIFFKSNLVKSDGWFFATELLIIAEKKGIRIEDLPIHWTDNSSTKVRVIRLSLEYLKEIFMLKLRLRNSK